MFLDHDMAIVLFLPSRHNIDPDSPPATPRNTGLALRELSTRKSDDQENR